MRSGRVPGVELPSSWSLKRAPSQRTEAFTNLQLWEPHHLPEVSPASRTQSLMTRGGATVRAAEIKRAMNATCSNHPEAISPSSPWTHCHPVPGAKKLEDTGFRVSADFISEILGHWWLNSPSSHSSPLEVGVGPNVPAL